MTQVQVNPADGDKAFESGLLACFPQWGGSAVSRWYFDRTAGGPRADRLVIADRGALLAGTAVTYRRLRLANGTDVPVGILTGAWTLPEARNQGFFSRLAAESVRLGRERGLALVLAFVTDRNPSSRALARLGFAGVRTVHHLAPLEAVPDRTGPPAPVMTEESEPGDLAARAQRRTDRSVGFVYPTARDWSSQFLERPHPTRILRLAGDARAVVEEVGDTDRIQLLLRNGQDWRSLLESIRGWCARRRRNAFLYSTTPALGRAATAAGFEPRGGRIRVAVVDDALLAGALGIPGRRRLAGAGVLLDPASDWYLGDWDVQSGDRM